jgi:sialic acid synthase SpsE
MKVYLLYIVIICFQTFIATSKMYSNSKKAIPKENTVSLKNNLSELIEKSHYNFSAQWELSITCADG